MFDLYTERVIQKTGLHSEEEGVKIGEGNDSRYADDIILLAERSHDLKQLLMNFNNNQKKKKKNPLLMRVKEESAKETAFEHQKDKNPHYKRKTEL